MFLFWVINITRDTICALNDSFARFGEESNFHRCLSARKALDESGDWRPWR